MKRHLTTMTLLALYFHHYLRLTLHVFLFMVLLIVIASCRVTIYCDGFDLNDHRDITFRNNDTIKYYAYNIETMDSIVFVVSDFYSSAASEETIVTIYPDHECDIEAYYQTNEIDGISIREYLGDHAVEVQIGNDTYSYGLVRYSQDHTITYESDYSIIYSFVVKNGEKQYYWTINDLSGNRRFDSFTKMENKGIVEFHDKHTGKHWSMSKQQEP